MKLEINWNEVVTKAVTAVVVGAFAGACIIVWRGATSVDDKVKTTENKLEFVIKKLSDKLAIYELRMNEMTNQLAMLLEQTKPEEPLPVPPVAVAAPPPPPVAAPTLPPTLAPQAAPQAAPPFSVEQRALSKDIYEQFSPAKK